MNANTPQDLANQISSDSPMTLLTLEVDGQAVAIPLQGTLALAEFVRQGDDLVITTPNGTLMTVPNYFAQAELPALVDPSGAVIPGSVVEQLVASTEELVQVAQLDTISIGQAIGMVETVLGKAVIVHADGIREQLHEGDTLFQGDVIETAPDASIGITLADETKLSLGENGKLVLDELIYDPDSSIGQASIDLIKGVFSFVSGQIAKAGADSLTITTPFASIGIRGTAGGIAVDEVGHTTVALLPEQNAFVGEIIVTTDTGTEVINQAFYTVSVGSSVTMGNPVALPEATLIGRFAAAIVALPDESGIATQIRDGAERYMGSSLAPATDADSDLPILLPITDGNLADDFAPSDRFPVADASTEVTVASSAPPQAATDIAIQQGVSESTTAHHPTDVAAAHSVENQEMPDHLSREAASQFGDDLMFGYQPPAPLPDSTPAKETPTEETPTEETPTRHELPTTHDASTSSLTLPDSPPVDLGFEAPTNGKKHALQIRNDAKHVTFGDDQDNTLIGGRGEDTLVGGRDEDTLVGYGGNDYLEGGVGDDIFVFALRDNGDRTDTVGQDGATSQSYTPSLEDIAVLGTDVIADFGIGDDTIVLSGRDFGFTAPLVEGRTYFKVNSLEEIKSYDLLPSEAAIVVINNVFENSQDIYYADDVGAFSSSVSGDSYTNAYQIAKVYGEDDISIDDFQIA